jgi:hypothetical protein
VICEVGGASAASLTTARTGTTSATRRSARRCAGPADLCLRLRSQSHLARILAPPRARPGREDRCKIEQPRKRDAHEALPKRLHEARPPDRHLTGSLTTGRRRDQRPDTRTRRHYRIHRGTTAAMTVQAGDWRAKGRAPECTKLPTASSASSGWAMSSGSKTCEAPLCPPDERSRASIRL